jgi:hypothetical protein
MRSFSVTRRVLVIICVAGLPTANGTIAAARESARQIPVSAATAAALLNAAHCKQSWQCKVLRDASLREVAYQANLYASADNWNSATQLTDQPTLFKKQGTDPWRDVGDITGSPDYVGFPPVAWNALIPWDHVAVGGAKLPGIPTCIGCRPAVKPANITWTADDSVALSGSTRARGIAWSHWGNRTASGMGAEWVNNCIPDCAGGTYTPYRATIALTRPRTLEGQMVFTRLSLTFSGSLPPPGQLTRTTTWDAYCEHGTCGFQPL